MKKQFRFSEDERNGTKGGVPDKTSFEFAIAQCAEKAGIDMLPVGDSMGICVYIYTGTVPVTMEQRVAHPPKLFGEEHLTPSRICV